MLIFESQWAFETSAYNHLGNHSSLKLNSSSDYCWLKEEHSVVEACHPCSDFEIASGSNKACVRTHFKETVRCHKSGKKEYRGCDRVEWLEEKRFWQFEGFVLVLAITSTACVFLRQRVLDHRHLKSLQRRLASSV